MEELEKELKKIERKNIILTAILTTVIGINILFIVGIISEINYNWTHPPHIHKMINQDKEIYNSTINKYIGEIKRGSEVKVMIEDVIRQNDIYVGESGKFISIKIVEGEKIDNLKNSKQENDLTGKALSKACDRANVYSSETGNNTQENIDVAKKEMRQLYRAIYSGKSYSVSDEDGDKSGVTDGVIHTVYIKEVK